MEGRRKAGEGKENREWAKSRKEVALFVRMRTTTSSEKGVMSNIDHDDGIGSDQIKLAGIQPRYARGNQYSTVPYRIYRPEENSGEQCEKIGMGTHPPRRKRRGEVSGVWIEYDMFAAQTSGMRWGDGFYLGLGSLRCK